MAGQNIEAIYRLSALQEGILFHALESPDSGVYFEQFQCTLEGQLDGERMRRAWEAAVARHSVLRTLFTWEKRDQPLQIVRQRVTLPFELLDWSGLTDAALDERLDSWLRLDRDRGFDLEKAPLTRITIMQVGENRHVMVWSFHHLLVDGWSMRLILDQVLADYDRIFAGGEPAGPAQSFGSFISHLQERDTGPEEEFFREMLAGFDTPVAPQAAPSDADAHRTGDANGMRERRMSDPLYERLKRIARDRRLTLNTLITGAWALLLSRHAGSDDVVFGTTLSGRPPELPDAEKIAGLFINTLPLRVRVEDGDKAVDFLQGIQRLQVAMREVAQTPLPVAQRASAVARGTPLFETIVVFENFPPGAEADERSLTLSDEQYVEYSNFPLALLAVPEESLTLYAVHDPRRFGAALTDRILQQVEALLESLAQNIDQNIGDLTLTDDATRRLVTGTWNDSAVDFGAVQPVHRQIARQALDRPDAVALTDAPGDTTYAALEANSNRLAHRLVALGATGRPVVVYAERSAAAVTGILAVLKSGGAYVPMDANYPADRLRLVLEDLAQDGDPIVLARDHLRERIDEGVTVVSLDDDHAGEADTDPGIDVDPAQAAYLIYTSGSTGRPKGVVVSHANLFNSTCARDHFYGAPPRSWLLMSSLATDSSVAGLFWTLCRGGKLVLPAARAEQDMDALAELIRSNAVSHILCVPSLYALMLETAESDALASVRAIMVAGEACPDALTTLHDECLSTARLFNEYGPSEATVWASVAELIAGEPVTIGRPIANTRLYVLDGALRPLPPGVAGELCIGGANVADGYYHREERTRAAFVPDPFANGDGARLYRSGDRARWRADGTLEFLGRIDDQIKVRGFRVEPGDIERVLLKHDQVDEAAVVVDPAGRLIGCVTGDADDDSLRDLCRRSLPDHMVPKQFAWLDELPKTPAGKVDRKALSRMDFAGPVQDRSGDEPTNAAETTLAAIWAEVLDQEVVGVHDDFFEAGGDSLLSIRILSRAAKAGLKISPEDFFAYPTVAGQAARAEVASEINAEQGRVVGALELLPIQHWFFESIQHDPHHWNQSILFRLTQSVDPLVLERSVQKLLLHHDALRTRFRLGPDGWSARIDDLGGELPVQVVDLGDADTQTAQRRMLACAAELNAGFELDEPPLIRFALFRLDNDDHRLLIVAHHLIVDAESWRTLLDDLAALCAALGKGEAGRLPAKTTSARAWSRRLQAFAREEAIAGQASFWQSQRDAVAGRVPVDGERGGIRREADAETLLASLGAEATARLDEALRQNLRAGMDDALLSALGRVLAEWSGREKMRVALEGHGREALFSDCDISHTIGWFTSVYPLTMEARDLETWRDPVSALRVAKEAQRNLPAKGIGYGILRYLGSGETAEALRAEPFPEVLFNYLGRDAADHSGALFSVEDPVFGPARSADANRAFLIEVNARIHRGELLTDWRFSPGVHERATIERLAERFIAALAGLTGEESTDSAHTPSDFPLADLDQSELDGLSDLLDDLD